MHPRARRAGHALIGAPLFILGRWLRQAMLDVNASVGTFEKDVAHDSLWTCTEAPY
jgi:hypothetical protein